MQLSIFDFGLLPYDPYIPIGEKIKNGLICFNVAIWLVEMYLTIREFKFVGKCNKIPPILKHKINGETFENNRQYHMSMLRLYIVDMTQIMVCVVDALYRYRFMWLWEYTFKVNVEDYARNIIRFGILYLWPNLIHSITTVYKWYFFEKKYIKDDDKIMFNERIKYSLKILVSIIFSLAVLEVIIKICIEIYIFVLNNVISYFVNTQYFYYIVIGVAWIILSLFVKYYRQVYTRVILYYWMKTTELKDCTLKTKIQKLCDENDIKIKNIYISREKVRQSNLSVSFRGYNKENLILNERLLKYPENETLCLILYKISTYKVSINKKISLYSNFNVFSFILLYLVCSDYYPLYKALGFWYFHNKPRTFLTFGLSYFVYIPLTKIIGMFVKKWYRQRVEQADELVLQKFDISTYENAIIRDEMDNYIFPTSDKLFYECYWQEPPLDVRLYNLRLIFKKML